MSRTTQLPLSMAIPHHSGNPVFGRARIPASRSHAGYRSWILNWHNAVVALSLCHHMSNECDHRAARYTSTGLAHATVSKAGLPGFVLHGRAAYPLTVANRVDIFLGYADVLRRSQRQNGGARREARLHEAGQTNCACAWWRLAPTTRHTNRSAGRQPHRALPSARLDRPPIVPIEGELPGSWLQRTARSYDLSAAQILDGWLIPSAPRSSLEHRVLQPSASEHVVMRMRAPLRPIQHESGRQP